VSDPSELLHWIERTWLSAVVRQSDWAVMALEAVHLLGLALLGGAALIAAMAAIRGSLGGIRLGRWVRGLRPMILTGLTLMASSGIAIAISMPFKYYDSPVFRWKMGLLACALAVTAAVARESRDTGRSRPAVLRALALLALFLWLGVGISGRLIGFL
jgi:hypothetical protein